MTSALSEEQKLLQESLDRFIEREYSFEQRNKIATSEEGFSRAHWRQFAELGWLAAGTAEEHGGLGEGGFEQMLIGSAFGRAMVLEPYVSTAAAGAQALALAEDTDLAGELLPQLVAGDLLVALAHAEREARFDLHHQATAAKPSGNAYVLDGNKLAVLDAPAADKLVVSARVEGDVRDPNGIGLFLVDTKASGLDLTAYKTMDGTPAAQIQLNECPAELLVAPGNGLDALERIVGRAIAVRCAQASGAMSAALEQTVEYAKTREQFGVTIGSFQVIQHRLIDLLIAARECRAMAEMVAGEVTNENPAERRSAVSAAKAFVGKRAAKAAQEYVQLHGGIGMTEEYAIGHYFRYLTQFCSDFGSAAHHLQRYTAQSRGE